MSNSEKNQSKLKYASKELEELWENEKMKNLWKRASETEGDLEMNSPDEKKFHEMATKYLEEKGIL